MGLSWPVVPSSQGGKKVKVLRAEILGWASQLLGHSISVTWELERERERETLMAHSSLPQPWDTSLSLLPHSTPQKSISSFPLRCTATSRIIVGICHDQSAHLPHFALLANNQSNPFASLHFTSFHLAATLSRWPMGQLPSWASCCHFCPHLHVAARTQSYLVTVLQKSSQWSPMIMGQRPTSPSWPRSPSGCFPIIPPGAPDPHSSQLNFSQFLLLVF